MASDTKELFVSRKSRAPGSSAFLLVQSQERMDSTRPPPPPASTKALKRPLRHIFPAFPIRVPQLHWVCITGSDQTHLLPFEGCKTQSQIKISPSNSHGITKYLLCCSRSERRARDLRRLFSPWFIHECCLLPPYFNLFTTIEHHLVYFSLMGSYKVWTQRTVYNPLQNIALQKLPAPGGQVRALVGRSEC